MGYRSMMLTWARNAKSLSAVAKDSRERKPSPKLTEAKKAQIRESLRAKYAPRDIAFSLGVSYTQVMNTRLELRSEGEDV